MRIQSTNQDWFYDDREYYTYILLNTSEEVYLKVQKSLPLHDVRVLKFSASFRPASNGIQYKWYIRVEGKNNKPPSREQIKSIIDEVLLSELKPLQPPVWVREKSDSTLAAKIAELEKSIEQKSKEYETANSKLKWIEKEKILLQSQVKNAQADLETRQQEIERLNQQIIGLFKPQDVKMLHENYEQRLADKDIQINNIKTEQQEYLDSFQPEIESKEHAIRELENKLSILEVEKAQIIEAQNFQEEKNIESRHLDESEKFFVSTVNVLLPDREFLRGSLEFIWAELPDTATVDLLSKIKNLSSLKAERVECDNRWKEFYERNNAHPWRMYFRHCKNSSYQVLISDKDNQKKDWEWLKRQPNC